MSNIFTQAERRAARWVFANPDKKVGEAPTHIRHTLNGTHEESRPYTPDVWKRMPHQGERECARRRRQMAKKAAKA